MEPIIQALMYLLLAKGAGLGGKKLALLVKVTPNVGFTFRGFAVEGLRPQETAAANVLFGDWTSKQTKDCILVLNYRPTEWCLGLMWSRFVSDVYFFENNAIFRISRQNNPPQGGYAQARFCDLPQLGGQALADRPRELVNTGPQGHRMWQSFEAANALVPSDHDPVAELDLPFLRHLPTVVGSCNSAIFRDAMLMKLAFALVGSSWGAARGGSLPAGNNIGAVLTDLSGAIIGWSVNVAGTNASLHAENALLRTYFCKKGGLPEGARLYTTLEPCHMCAGLIAACCPELKVFYGQKDPSIENNALARRCNGSEQTRLADVAARSVESAWSQFLLGSTDRNTLTFLKSPTAQNAFGRLQLVPEQMQRTLFAMATAVGDQPIKPSSANALGRYGLDAPGGRIAAGPPINRTLAGQARPTTRGLNLDVDKRLTPPVPGGYRPGGFRQELMMTEQCLQLLENLQRVGAVTLPL